jgi:hypothetical protein
LNSFLHTGHFLIIGYPICIYLFVKLLVILICLSIRGTPYSFQWSVEGGRVTIILPPPPKFGVPGVLAIKSQVQLSFAYRGITSDNNCYCSKRDISNDWISMCMLKLGHIMMHYE